MRHVILGTAGHIDHGKTSLVKALTGTDTDRLPEEKARGITIDLGFAHLQLDDLSVGVVDVPGHEALIRNMLAGATGFDGVLLVVAADEGIMPQTREHLAIVELLGIRQLIVAITKSDMVDAEWLDLVHTELREWLSDTLFAQAPIIATSVADNSGINELRVSLHNELSKASLRGDSDLFRMPIDRVFTVRGTGTVVTGTVWSGSAGRDAVARVLPGARSVRVRGCQTHGVAVERAHAGERAAFALAGIERRDVIRGDVLLVGTAWEEITFLTARLRTISNVELKHRQRVRVHLGTAEVMARVVVLGGGWMQLRLEDPLVARAGDRFVLRSFSPLATIGGGAVAETGRIRKRLSSDDADALTQILDGSPTHRLQAALRLAGKNGCAADRLPIVTGLSPEEVTAALTGDVVMIDHTYFLASIVEAEITRVIEVVRQYHMANPLKPGIESPALLTMIDSPLGQAAMERAEASGALLRRGSVIAVRDFAPTMTPAQQILRDKLMHVLAEAGLAPPSVAELTQALKSNDVRSVLRLLQAEGNVVAIAPDTFIDAATLQRALEAVRRLSNGPLPAAEFKSALPVSRKFLIPLLEYMDRSGITRRDGDLRWIVPS